jgi:hypothetical protein
MKHHLAHGVLAVLAIGYDAIHWGTIREHAWEAIVPCLWALSLAVIWHSVRAAMVVTTAIKKAAGLVEAEGSVFTAQGNKVIILTPSSSVPPHYRLKVWCSASLLIGLSVACSGLALILSGLSPTTSEAVTDHRQVGGAGEDKFKLYALARKIHDNPQNVTLTAEEIVILKERIGKVWDAEVVGAAWRMLDPSLDKYVSSSTPDKDPIPPPDAVKMPPCPGGICDSLPIPPKIRNLGTVGIYGGYVGVEPLTTDHHADVKTEGSLAMNPGQAVFFTVDREFPNAAFLIQCDRPCKATNAIMHGSIYFAPHPLDTEKANITAMRTGTPTPLESGSEIGITVRSRDKDWIHVLRVEGYITSVH